MGKARDYAGEDGDVTLQLWARLKPRLATEHMVGLYETIERPLIPVLLGMETAGIKIDAPRLRTLSAEFEKRMLELEQEIHKIAGRPFNVGSPKQLGEILFDEQNLPGGQGNNLPPADYSQIELRLRAHVADIASLKAAFARGDDIHAITASEMFGVPVKGMDPLVRRRAKAINFGIIYGISAFGLANQLGIGQQEAPEYIAKYFLRYPGIRDYIETTKPYALKHGYLKTPFARKIHLKYINDKNQGMRAFS